MTPEESFAAVANVMSDLMGALTVFTANLTDDNAGRPPADHEWLRVRGTSIEKLTEEVKLITARVREINLG